MSFCISASPEARRKTVSTENAVPRKSAKHQFNKRAAGQLLTYEQTGLMHDPHAECADWLPVTNDERARWASGAIEAFCAVTGSDIEDGAFHDLLCDLGHYADRHDLDFRHEIHRALETWLDECEDEQRDAAAGNP